MLTPLVNKGADFVDKLLATCLKEVSYGISVLKLLNFIACALSTKNTNTYHYCCF
jgi:hypothetical protein